MTLLRFMILLHLTTMMALGQPAPQSKPPSIPQQPGETVGSLYREVVARHPIGIPKASDMKALAPYLSKSLLNRIDLARGCENDYYHRYEKPNEKPQIEWLEFGLFTGGNEKVSPREYHIERTQSQEDGSFRVYLRLTWGSQPKPWIWRVVAIVVREKDHFVVDNVIFLKDERTLEDESRLSETLAAGCDGSRWVGYSKQPNTVK